MAAAIKGTEGLTGDQLQFELQNGARFVVFQYCISILVMSFKRSSDVHFVRANEPTLTKALPFSLLSLLVGWWGFPWGPIWTISTVFQNSRGGLDVTADVVQSLSAGALTA